MNSISIYLIVSSKLIILLKLEYFITIEHSRKCYYKCVCYCIIIITMLNVMDKNSTDNRFVDVNPNSPEWALIEYKLQLATGSTTAVVKKIQSLNNPTLATTFEKTNKGALQIDSFMLKETLDEGTNRFEKVVEKGFDFPKNGIKFTVGFLKMQSQQGKTYEIIMYKIAVGKSYCMPAKSYSKDKVQKVEGFDSVYLYN